MVRRLAAAAVLSLLAALPTLAQNVRLQFFDHIVGSELLHNTPLPEGTEVWVMGKADARATRLRGGYGEVLGSLPTAVQDRLEGGGFTVKSYPVTARSRRSLYVLARLPDGRLFQSFVKTADAGWQPGFDAIQGGRVSMGRVPEAMAARLAGALAPTAPTAATPAATPTADTSAAAARPPVAAADTLAASDTLLTPTATPSASVESVAAVPPSAVAVDEGAPAARRWAWLPFFVGLGVGALVAGAATMWRYERMLQRQREHLMRLVPDDAQREQAEAAHAERVRLAQEAEQQRSDRVFQQIELLQEALKARDSEIARLRRLHE